MCDHKIEPRPGRPTFLAFQVFHVPDDLSFEETKRLNGYAEFGCWDEGWYWWPARPGQGLSDGDPQGPFGSRTQAVAHAMEQE